MEDPLLNPLPSAASNEDELGPFPPPPLGLETDPFYAFRDELAYTTRKSWQRIEKLKLLGKSEEILSEVASIRKGLASLKENVSHLERVVSHVERKRADFSHLSDEDVQSRRNFLRIVQNRVRQMEQDLASSSSQADQLAEKERKQLRAQQEAKSRASISPIKSVRDEDSFDRESQRYVHEQVLKEQDESLGEISNSLGRLHDVGMEMYQEIESQNRLLDDVNEDAHGLNGKMDTALGRLDKILHTKSRGQTMGILFLVLVLLIEIIIVSII